jgi:hypothetical protein
MSKTFTRTIDYNVEFPGREYSVWSNLTLDAGSIKFVKQGRVHPNGWLEEIGTWRLKGETIIGEPR